METNAVNPDDWVPVLRGEIFCSPACGGRCTKAAHDLAMKNAIELAARLGAQWKPVVSENLGWHYKVISPCGRIKVHPGTDGYTAFLSEPGCVGGRWAECGRTPAAAIMRTVEKARAEVAALQAIIEGL